MPSVLSKLVLRAATVVPPEWILMYVQLTKLQKLGIVGAFLGIIAFLKKQLLTSKKSKRKGGPNAGNSADGTPRRRSPGVNWEFLKQMKFLLQIMIPKLWSKQVGILVAHSITLIARTFLSIYVAELEGTIVKEIVQRYDRSLLRKRLLTCDNTVIHFASFCRNVGQFFALLGKWILIAIPACICNSSIRFLEKHLALSLRSTLVKKAYDEYFSNQIYYRVGNLDTRIPNPDHSLTEDIAEFSTSVAHLYSHIAKPLLDCLMISVTLLRRGRSIGSNLVLGPAITLSVIALTAQILKGISPRFGQLVAVEADLKAKLRHKHSRIVTNSEEIAFYGGAGVEKKVLQDAYLQECKQSKKIYFAKWWYVFFEQFLMKYIWSGSGMVVTAIPILTGMVCNRLPLYLILICDFIHPDVLLCAN